MFGEIVEVTDEPYPHPEALYGSFQVLTQSQVQKCEVYISKFKTSRRDSPSAFLDVGMVEAIEAKTEENKAKIKENRAWERKYGIIYVKPFNDGKIPAALTVPVTNDDEAKAFSKEWSKFFDLANADKCRQILQMVEEKKFRVYRQLEWPEPAQKQVWRLYATGGGPAKDEQPGPVAKSGKRPRSDYIDLTLDDD